MEDLLTECSLDLQAKWVIDVFGQFLLTSYPWMILQTGTGTRPVNWCMNEISVL